MMTTLRLNVISAPADSPLKGQTLEVSIAGTTLGRATGNAVVLVDQERVVSSRHASIRHDLGQFLLTDHSTNGTYLNDNPVAIGAEKSVPLQNGDLIIMGKYRLQVDLPTAAAAPAPAEPSFLDKPLASSPPPAQFAPVLSAAPASASALDDFDQWLEPQATPAAQQQPLWGISNVEHAVSGGFDDINDPLAAIDKAQQTDNPFGAGVASLDDDPDWWKGSQADNAAPLNQAFSAPRPLAPEPVTSPAINNDFHSEATPVPVVDDADNLDALLGLDSNPPPPQPAAAKPSIAPVPASPPPPAQPMAAGSADAGELLAHLLGLGSLTPEQQQNLPAEVAGVTREAIARMVDMLRARSSIKNELRIDRTMIRAAENNPLKFALTEQDALRYLFGERSGAYLSGRNAVQEAFRDMELHQLALLAGMRAAYQKMLDKFSPDALEQQFGGAAQGGFLSNKKARLWDAYTEYFDKLRQDPEAGFNRLFGNDFANAYEEQVEALKQSGRKPAR